MTKKEMIERYGEDGYKKHIEAVKARQKERYMNDPEFHERHKANMINRTKERYREDPEFRKYMCMNFKMKYCSGNLEDIENYELAKNDNFIGWDLHHRLEIDENGKRRFSLKQLKEFGLYYKRPVEELIWLPHNLHMSMHALARRKA